jgi:hypothetical protein
MRPLVLILLAITAVLCGAPSPVLATDPATAPAADPAGLSFGPLGIGIGIGGIAALALVAWTVRLFRGRRRDRAKPSEGHGEAPSGPTSAEEQVTAVLHRRTLRRARVRLEEDPIIASMGVGTQSRAETRVGRARRSARSSPPT